jgi:capsular exopolysaccharide synthesis family protein
MENVSSTIRFGEGEVKDLRLPSNGHNGRNGTAQRTTVEEMPGAAQTITMRISDSSPLLCASEEDHRAAEQYRILRTRIVQHPKKPALIVISSAGSGEGKTVTAVNLAGTLALQSGKSVLLLDADLRRSSAHRCLGIRRVPGLAEVLAGECQLNGALAQSEQLPNFYMLPAGVPSVNPAELFDSPGWPALAEHLRRQFRHVIIDSPPIEAVADYDLITAACDGVVLVVRPDHTERKACMSALKKVAHQLLGVVMNDEDEWLLSKRSSAYDYSRPRKASNPQPQ